MPTETYLDTPSQALQGEAVAFRPFGWLACMRSSLLIGGAGAIPIVIRSQSQGGRAIMITVCVYAAMMVVFVLIQAVRLRGGGALRFDGDALFLPINAYTTRGRRIPYASIRAANLAGGRRWPSFVVDAGRHVHAYPLRRFAEPDAPDRIQALLRSRLMPLPGGAARWADIERLRGAAEDLRMRRPWVTWSLCVAILLVFGLQWVWPHLGLAPDDGLSDIDVGANAASLVSQGQAWRLVTASLMHAGLRHLLNNLLSLYVFGSLLERLIGNRRILLLALLTGIVSEAASAALGPHLGGYVYSVGISGALFGLMGALAVVTWRLGMQLPAGFRLPPRVWLLLLGLNLLVTALLPQVDKGAHAGGLLAGAALGWLLFARARNLGALQAPSRPIDVALAAVAAICLLSLAGDLRHAADPASPLRDRIILMRAELAIGDGPPGVENQLAYAVALQPAAGGAAWRDALRLATRAEADAAKHSNTIGMFPAIEDTAAVLDSRLGDTIGALQQEIPLLASGGQEIRAHVAGFLAEAGTGGAALSLPRAVADPSPVETAIPTVALRGGLLRLRVSELPPRGAELFSLLRQRGAIRGILVLDLPPGLFGTRVFRPPEQLGSRWRDGFDTIDVALFDRSDCYCVGSEVSAHWYPLDYPLASVRVADQGTR